MEKFEDIEKQGFEKVISVLREAKEKHYFINLSQVRKNMCSIRKSLRSLESGAALFCTSDEELKKVQSRVAFQQGRLRGYKYIQDYCNGKNVDLIG